MKGTGFFFLKGVTVISVLFFLEELVSLTTMVGDLIA